MRYTIFNIILISTLFTLLASAQNDKDVVEVQQILMRQAADWNKGDIEAFMVGYWNSPDLQFIGSRGVTKGYENTLRNYLKSYPDRKTMGQLSFDVISIDKLSRKSIMLTGQYTLARKEMEDASGYFLLVWKKIKKKWVIVADHSN
jgi:hypothetical protein